MEENNKSRGARYGEGAFCTKAFQYGFGFMMAVLLGVGDTFHLVPRIIVCFRGSMRKQELQFLYLQ